MDSVPTFDYVIKNTTKSLENILISLVYKYLKIVSSVAFICSLLYENLKVPRFSSYMRIFEIVFSLKNGKLILS